KLICAICLGRHPHKVIECCAPRTWDKRFDTFCSRFNKAIITKDKQSICSKWQRDEGCTDRHDDKHLCSGCGAATHGASRCPRAQNA
ncbi:hypothetical protein BJ138DRAFT_1019880, partial [Hygrophoropsis aurantiaca]